MEITFRKAKKSDLEAVGQIYENILASQENGGSYVGWVRGVYPTGQTAADALERDDLFVQEAAGRIVGAAIINRVQVDVYADVAWQYPAEDEQVMVLHTLVIEPEESRQGLGKAFVEFYEGYAAENGCAYLRMDTNARNVSAELLQLFSKENPLWETYLLFARIFGMSRREFEELSIDEIGATLAHIYANKLHERQLL